MSDGCDDFVLISALRGPVRVIQGEKTIDLASAQMCLTEMNICGFADLTQKSRFTTTRIPRRLLLQVASGAETRLARPLQEDPALIIMIERYFALCSDVAQNLDAAGQKTAAQHLVDLVGLLVGTNADRSEVNGRRGQAGARLELMKAEVLSNLHKRDMSVDTIAQAYGLGARQAQRLFAQSGITFTEFVLQQRLLRARQLLLDRRNRHRKVSDIAYASGFSDLSYFNRTFRKCFGLTPTEIQADRDFQ